MESFATRVDVAIIGGGIAGLAMAAALADAPLSVAIIEARTLPAFPSDRGADVHGFDRRVSALTPHSIAFLQRLGAWEAIVAVRDCAYQHMTVWDAEGTGRIEFDAAEVSAPSLGSIVENRLITASLAQRVQSLSNVRVLAPERLEQLQPHDEGYRLVLASGGSLDCGLVVAADGALSPTRGLLGLPTREWNYDHRAIVTTAAFTNSHEQTAWQCFLPSGPLALLPLGGDNDRLCSIVWSIQESQADDLLALDDAGFAAALSAASEHVLGPVTDCAARQGFPLRQRHAIDYVLPGAALVGDAAHTIHPLAGQGINLGLADVEVLAKELLTAVGRGLAPGRIEVLRRYQRQRKGENLAMMAAMDGFKRLFEQDAPPLRWLRNTGMRGVARVPALKRRIIRQAMGVA